jgi:glycosyltransferase involved in cell wall biosynthesis
MRIALVYDCVYPNTVGGAERWLRELSERLGEDHEVTYLTRRQWSADDPPSIPGVRCVAVSPRGDLYTPEGRRRLVPPLLFGLGVFLHFLRNRRSYDIVHCASYPYFSLIGLRLALAGTGGAPRIYCEWLEYLSAEYWRRYGGRLLGAIGRRVQHACLRLTPSAFAFSDLVASRLREDGFTGDLCRLSGLWLGPEPPWDGPQEPGEPPVMLFAGRHIPDKGVTEIPAILAAARESIPGLRAVVVGDGPERRRLQERAAEMGLADVVHAPGFVSREELELHFRSAACLVSPSRRDGHGMVIPEATAWGVPVVTCRETDNAGSELISEGVNGMVARDGSPAALAEAVVAVITAGAPLRHSTREWFDANRSGLSASQSVERVKSIYSEADRHSSGAPNRTAVANV